MKVNVSVSVGKGIRNSRINSIGIVKKKELKEAAAVSDRSKRQKSCEYPEMEKSLLEWFKQVPSR